MMQHEGKIGANFPEHVYDTILQREGVSGQSPHAPGQTNNVPRSGAIPAATIVTRTGGDADTAAPVAVRLERDRATRGAATMRAAIVASSTAQTQSTRLSIRGIGGVDPVARSLRSPELHRRSEPEYH